MHQRNLRLRMLTSTNRPGPATIGSSARSKHVNATNLERAW
jgi:hypothetical protein